MKKLLKQNTNPNHYNVPYSWQNKNVFSAFQKDATERDDLKYSVIEFHRTGANTLK